MPIERAKFEIQAGVSAGDTSGAEQVSGKLDELAKKAASAAGGVDDVGRSAEKTGEKFGESKHEIHAALHALNEFVPGAAELGHFLQNNLFLEIGVGVELIAKLRDRLEEMKKTIESLDSGPGASGEWAEKQAAAMRDAVTECLVYQQSLETLGKTQETLRDRTAELITRQKELASAQSDVSTAQKALEEARVNAAEKLGQMTKDQAIKIRVDIDEHYFAEQLKEKTAAIQAELSARREEASQNQGRLRQLQGDVSTKEDAAAEANARKIRNDEKLAQDRKNLEDSKAAGEKAAKIIEDLEEKKPAWGYDQTDPQFYALKAAQDSQAAEQSRQGLLRRAIKQEEDKSPSIDADAQNAKAEADAARAALTDATKEANDAKKQIANLEEQLRIEKAKDAEIQKLHNQAAEQNANTEAGHEVFRPPPPEPVIRLVVPDSGVPDTHHGFERHVQNVLSSADAAISRFRQTGGAKGSLGVTTDKLEEMVALLHEGNETHALTASTLERLSNEVAQFRSELAKCRDRVAAIGNTKHY